MTAASPRRSPEDARESVAGGCCALCSSGWFIEPGSTQNVEHNSFYLFNLSISPSYKKNPKFCKNPMRENKVTNRLVCDAMLKLAKDHLTQQSTDSDLAHLLD